MKYIYFLTYYMATVVSFCIIPFVELVICIITGEPYDIRKTYKDWKDHYDSGDNWGLFDKGRDV